MSSLRVGLIGTGALGSEVCRLLLERGQRGVLLIDPDTIEPRNLALSTLFAQAGSAALGRPKVDVLHAFSREAGLDWQPFHGEVADLGLQRLQEVDVLLSCTDSALARVETAFAARALGLPMLDAGVQSHGVEQGRVTCFALGADAACYLCGLPEARRAELLAFAQSTSLGCTLPAEAAMTGAPGTVQATAAALLELLQDNAGSSTSFARRLQPGRPAQRIALPRSADCPWHRLGVLQALPYDEPLCTLLAPGEIIEFPWPICLRARCRCCGHRFAPRRRTALVRRRIPCPACHEARALEPLESLASLTGASPPAAQTLRQLGLPARHLYHLRSAAILEGSRSPAIR